MATRNKRARTRVRRDPPHVGILYEGPSPATGEPIVAISTTRSRNDKTGRTVEQVWIIRSDMNPVRAKECGKDIAICGYCPTKDACYVQVGKAPLSVYKKYKRGRYQRIDASALAGRKVRWGAYGDPAMLPIELVLAVNAVAASYVGYTHQFKTPHGKRFKGVFMASVETQRQEDTMRLLGWSTFRAGRRDGSDRGTAELCDNSARGTKCEDCMRCDGKGAIALFIESHGALAKYAVAERRAA